MTFKYVAKVGSHYLYPCDGDIGFTDDWSEAGLFDTEEEAREHAEREAKGLSVRIIRQRPDGTPADPL